MKRLKENIKAKCKEKGITIHDMCIFAGVPYECVRKWGTHMPSALALVKVAKALGTTAEELLKGVA